MKPLMLHRGARIDLREAVDYTRRDGLGMEFSEAVFAVLDEIAKRPDAFPEHDRGDAQIYILSRFPYSVIFRETTDAVWILAIAHHSRDERYWQIRKPSNGTG